MHFITHYTVSCVLYLSALCNELVNCDHYGAMFWEEMERNSDYLTKTDQVDCLRSVTSIRDINLAIIKVCGMFTHSYKLKFIKCCKVKKDDAESEEKKRNEKDILDRKAEEKAMEKINVMENENRDAEKDEDTESKGSEDGADGVNEERVQTNDKETEVISGQVEDEEEKETGKRQAPSEGKLNEGSIDWHYKEKFDPRHYLT